MSLEAPTLVALDVLKDLKKIVVHLRLTRRQHNDGQGEAGARSVAGVTLESVYERERQSRLLN